MKIHIGVDPDEGQSVTVQMRDVATGADTFSRSVAPGQMGAFDMPNGSAIHLIHGEVHFDNGAEATLTPAEPDIRGEPVTERRLDPELEDVEGPAETATAGVEEAADGAGAEA